MGDNIPFFENFDYEVWKKSQGHWPKPIISRDSIEGLPHPPPSWKSLCDNFSYDEQAPAIEDGSRVVINRAEGPNSYFAAVSLLIYGDEKFYFRVRIQHLLYFEQVLDSPLHPRHKLYNRINREESGSNFFTLQDRLNYGDCWVEHSLVQQVTADLYDIYLSVLHYHQGQHVPPHTPISARFDCLQERGNPTSPRRYLLFSNNRHYQPYVHLPDYIAPIVPNQNIRKPFPDVQLPMPVVQPTPFKGLSGQNRDGLLSRILWVRFESPKEEQKVATHLPSPVSLRSTNVDKKGKGKEKLRTPQVSNKGKSKEPVESPKSDSKDKGKERVEASNKEVSKTVNVSASNPPKDIKMPTLILPRHAGPPPSELGKTYIKMKAVNLERLIKERNIKVPETVYEGVDGNEKRRNKKRHLAMLLKAEDLKNSHDGRTAKEVLDLIHGPRKVTSSVTTEKLVEREERTGAILTQIYTQITTKVVTSVPERWVPTDREEHPVPKNGVDYHKLDEEALTRLLLRGNLVITGDRDTDIETYREWRRKWHQDKDDAATKEKADAKKTRKGDAWKNREFDSRRNADGDFTVVNLPRIPDPDLELDHAFQEELERPPEPESNFVDEEEEQEEETEDEEEAEADSESESSPEPITPDVPSYASWSAAALRRDALSRNPPIQTPPKEKAAVTKATLPALLLALDQKARDEREAIRMGKRARAELKKAEAEDRPVKRAKTVEATDEEVVEGGDEEDGPHDEDEEFTVVSPERYEVIR